MQKEIEAEGVKEKELFDKFMCFCSSNTGDLGKADREQAKSDIAEATTLREKEAAEFSAMKADSETNIAAMASAIPAIEKGMGGAALLQMPAVNRIHKLIESTGNMDPMDRREALAFLEGTSELGSEGAGQILGILPDE